LICDVFRRVATVDDEFVDIENADTHPFDAGFPAEYVVSSNDVCRT
jgi:hypothetical protein